MNVLFVLITIAVVLVLFICGLAWYAGSQNTLTPFSGREVKIIKKSPGKCYVTVLNSNGARLFTPVEIIDDLLIAIKETDKLSCTINGKHMLKEPAAIIEL